MSRANKNKHEKPEVKKEVKLPEVVTPKVEEVAPETKAAKPGTVLMKFSEHKYYNDMNTPIFYAGKVYELEGPAWIERWLRRGGELVAGEQIYPVAEQNYSAVVAKEVEKAEDVQGDVVEK